ncbi:hypothetical protein FRC09_015084 [Ceratobasidium sp. 395]|nr:hypothetical protein FRC09_015084 [Ceratobasidium sp. 395]
MVLLLQASISRLWRTLDPAEDNQPLTYERLREVVQFPGVLLLYTMMRRSTASVPEVMPMHTAAIPLLNGVLDLNILGLLARTLMFPLPRNYGTLDPIQQGSLEIIFNDQLKAIDEFGNFLSSIVTCTMEIDLRGLTSQNAALSGRNLDPLLFQIA